MPDETLYHGTIYLMNTETGEEANVAVQIAISPTSLAYTMRSLVCDEHGPSTVSSDDPTVLRLAARLLEKMVRVSVPA